jgi:hypothetical protein
MPVIPSPLEPIYLTDSERVREPHAFECLSNAFRIGLKDGSRDERYIRHVQKS